MFCFIFIRTIIKINHILYVIKLAISKRLLKELPFYNAPIEKPKIKKFNNVEAFKKYTRSCNIEVMKDKDGSLDDPLTQLEASKPVIKGLFGNLLTEMKAFKYQITLTVYLSKQKGNGDTEFSNVSFNFTAITGINLNKYGRNKSFQHALYRIDNWITEGSAWTI